MAGDAFNKAGESVMTTANDTGATSKQMRKPMGQQDRELTEDELNVVAGGWSVDTLVAIANANSARPSVSELTITKTLNPASP
jgi:hypothetical protein